MTSGAFRENHVCWGGTETTVFRPCYFILFCFTDLNLNCEQLKSDINLNTTHLGDPVGNFSEKPHPLASSWERQGESQKKTLKKGKIKGKI